MPQLVVPFDHFVGYTGEIAGRQRAAEIVHRLGLCVWYLRQGPQFVLDQRVSHLSHQSIGIREISGVLKKIQCACVEQIQELMVPWRKCGRTNTGPIRDRQEIEFVQALDVTHKSREVHDGPHVIQVTPDADECHIGLVPHQLVHSLLGVAVESDPGCDCLGDAGASLVVTASIPLSDVMEEEKPSGISGRQDIGPPEPEKY